MGIAERTTYIKINFPALVNHCPPQEAISAFILAITSNQSEGGLGPRVRGNPIYLSFSHLSKPGKPKVCSIQCIAR